MKFKVTIWIYNYFETQITSFTSSDKNKFSPKYTIIFQNQRKKLPIVIIKNTKHNKNKLKTLIYFTPKLSKVIIN